MSEINEDVIKLVIARISTMPPTVKLSIGGAGSFTKDQLIRHVEDGDEIGKLIIDMHLNYLSSMVKQK